MQSSRNKIRTGIALLTLSLAACATDSNPLVGTWKSATINGQPANYQVVYTSATMTDGLFEMTYVIDDSASPHHYDLMEADGNSSTRTPYLGIYKIERSEAVETLTVKFAEQKGTVRPVDFALDEPTYEVDTLTR